MVARQCFDEQYAPHRLGLFLYLRLRFHKGAETRLRRIEAMVRRLEERPQGRRPRRCDGREVFRVLAEAQSPEILARVNAPQFAHDRDTNVKRTRYALARLQGFYPRSR